MDVDEGGEDRGIPVQEIDAYWLQREVSKAVKGEDANAMQHTAEEAFKALEQEDERDIENQLVLLLGFDHFELIKVLLQNRLKIVWCTKLARARNDEERHLIEGQMVDGGPHLIAILDATRATRASAKERQRNMEKSIREEARKLRDESMVQPLAASEAIDAANWQASQRKALSLEDLSFAQGGHLMSNSRCELPQGSYRTTKKGYEEVHVPALKAKPMQENEVLKKLDDLPEWSQAAFAGMKSLNRVQSRVYETALFSPENMLVCAPTGAGKTNIAMLTILHEIGLHRLEDGSIDLSAFKIVYVAPMKALVAEMVGNFTKRLSKYGINARELTGDSGLTRQEIDDTQIIVTTPEKWDIITRKSGDRTYTQLVKLLIIDEIHLLHDGRGPVLESLVARTVRQIELTQQMIRLVGLSATLPNYDDVATFLRVNPEKGLFFFDNSFRPCPLQQTYIGVTVKKPLQKFQLMNDICYEKTLEAAGKHQVLIFVHSRKETAKTARFLRDTAMANGTLAKFLKEDSASREILQAEADGVKNADLKDLLAYGFAIHHAGMSRSDRTLVEDLFADGHVQVLASTATLAWGVNLPAHSVIIKGTQVYNPEKGAWDELSPLDVMQMFGRAGRPQFDTFGEGTIITGHSELQFYLSLLNQQLPIESQYVSKLADNLTAEVVLGTVSNAREAVHWLGYTYLYIRMLRNPTLYGVHVDILDSDELLEGFRADLVHTAATLLDKHGLVKYDRKSGSLQATDLGRISSHYYVSHATIAAFSESLKPSMSDIEICRLFSLAEEFKFLVVREEEKVELAKLLEIVPIPIKESIEEPSAKVNVLLQAYISKSKMEGLSLMSDMVYVTQSANRLLRALFEISLRRGWAALAEKTLNFCKMASRRMWMSQTPLRQFNRISDNALGTIERNELPWERYYDLTSQELGELVHFPKMGKTLHRLVHLLPRLELQAHVQPITRAVLRVDLTITADFMWDDATHGSAELFWVIVEDHDGETILHYETFLLRKANVEDDHTLTFTVPVTDPMPPQYFVRVVSDKWIGSASHLPISFRHLLLPEKFAPPTELLDLQPLPVSALREESFEKLYSDHFSHFNPIQTQVFTALYNTDDNVLLGAPTSSGKTICAEFAILRALSKGACKCVYVAPFQAIVTERYDDWSVKFRELGLNVIKLSGESASDLKQLEKADIALSTPERWDMLSRRWKQRKAIQAVTLFIADELHLVGAEIGPTIEVIVSRMRYMSSQAQSQIRVVGLSSSLANARDVGEWIGATSNGLFNFHPGVRPVPLEIYIQGLDVANFDNRMQAMIRPTYMAINTHCSDEKPAIVFVPTRKHTRQTALELMASFATDPEPKRLLHCEQPDLESFMDKLTDPALKHTVAFGVAFLHESQGDEEQSAVKALYSSGAVQLLVVSVAMCWGLSLSAHLVVVMGTQFYDAQDSGQADYAISDLLQIMGRASRPALDSTGKCVIMCHAPRKEYYKRFLYEPLPVESHLDHVLHDHINAEVVTRTIESKQDAVDYLTWSLLYRRLTMNPNYYGLQGLSHRHISDHLSQLIETVVGDLEQSKCLTVEDDMELAPINLGMIAAFYYIRYTTIELFSSSLTAKTKLKGLLEILASSSEFEDLPCRPGEPDLIKKLLAHQPLSVETTKYSEPSVKANALLQAHFSRTPITGDLRRDTKEVLGYATRLLQAMVDVISSSGWLNSALGAMELSQMVTQGLWERDSVLLQLPHFTKDLAKKCADREVEGVFDLIEMEDDDRRALLGMSDTQLEDVAAVCNRYPNIEVKFNVTNKDEIVAGDSVTIAIGLERELEDDEEVHPVHCPLYPKQKDEGWWLVVGMPSTNQLLAIKRLALNRKAKVKLEFQAPLEAGQYAYTLYFMCDSYMGCDQVCFNWCI
eukprot:scaffold4916_cov371-Prasinococcus_capsulatus_cf.AAC.3